MRRRERNWTLGPFTMWRHDFGDHLGGPAPRNYSGPKRKIDGATITDETSGLIYQAMIERADGRARLIGITILTTRPEQRIDQDTIRRVPVQRIAEQASLHLAEQEAAGMPVFASGPHLPKHDGPTLEEVAQDHKDGLNRAAIAAKRHTSVYTIDKRLREARDRGLIGPPTTGRPRAPKTSGSSPDEPSTTKRRRDRK
ncbi:hypothetical protein [Nocardioides soli]|uniref:Uncharacterized protein n=1 Tax=Nocardioides soli TaxID=1036020 RepID=A0A7W4VUE6_9ACTN|nr:hypothetical protein [Nocardioides soli]MBB3041976.1 hypothetical protein [Nocardioides soli]